MHVKRCISFFLAPIGMKNSSPEHKKLPSWKQEIVSTMQRNYNRGNKKLFQWSFRSTKIRMEIHD